MISARPRVGDQGFDGAPGVDAQTYASAILNILEDSAGETERLVDTQRAVLNILDDFAEERGRLDAAQSALLNILADATEEKEQLADTQRAVLNILEDFDAEKSKVEQANASLRREVTERLRAEESLRRANAVAEAANRELEAFSYSVAHDLRAPLRSIDGFSLAMMEDYAERLDDTGKSYLGFIRSSAQQMAQLINDLLALSRVTRADLRRAEVDIAAVAHRVVARLRQADPDRDVDVAITEPLPVFADPGFVEIVLDNLLGNAWKFTRKRETALIEVGRTEAPGPAVYFVRDNGAGFDMAYAEKLFAVFQRLHTAREFEGVGVGLATVQRIVFRHGGRVWAEGEVGSGAVFYFTFEDGE